MPSEKGSRADRARAPAQEHHEKHILRMANPEPDPGTVSGDNDEDTRYRGFDIDSDEENTARGPEPAETTTGDDTAILNEGDEKTLISTLQKKLHEQSVIINQLKAELAKRNDNVTDANDKNAKKRKRDEEVMNVALINDSHDKDIRIKTLLEENALLKRQLEAADTLTPKPDADDKGSEARKKRVLPVPNPVAVIEGLQSTIIENIKDVIGSLIDEKLQNKLCPSSTTDAQPSYASAVGKTDQVHNFREIMAAAKNEDLAEEREKNYRLSNLIIHGMEESDDDQSNNDEVFIKQFINDLQIGKIETKSINRIGQKCEGKKRPVKVVVQNSADKTKIMNNLSNLKNKGYNGISVKDDYTMTERNMIRDFVEKAKLANANEMQDSDKMWVVRGTPKNGLFLKKVTRSARAQPSSQTQ